uniref:Transmembrane protein n=1 Tax=Chromera velia CCMP2878 TaxID=1169474 RepID=A0A0G4FR54_9ALVE|eukprot:Cvel_18320.t1-p1 / transcript=Cvel_18320.t1 / gene=Cvel_18320 / organism=Chromera_velia_CCMP2878 / gene_product=hypothetical protein / transcript_product=hypothetical protein / location=Cvel_scaffold1512:21-3307(+) / protein_length=495 / sequence_SO=supercontig / SO=protein_coding / is_pseudo=false
MSGTELGGGPRGGTGAVAREGVGMDAAAVFSDGEEIGGDGEEEPEEEGQEEGEEGGSAGSLGTSVSLSDGGGSERDQEEGGADVGGGGKKTFQAEHTGVHGAPPVRRESSVTLTDSDGSSEGVTPTSQQEQRESLEHPTAILPRHPAHTARPGYEADQWQRCESPGGRERSPATRQSEGFALYHSRHSFGTMMHSMSQLTDLSSASADSLGSLSSDLEEEGLRLELSRSASVAMAGGGALGDNLNKRRRSIQQGTSPSHLASLRSCLRLWRRDLTKALPVPGLFLFPFSKLSLTEKAAVFFFQQNLTLLMCAVFSFLVDGAILGWAAVGSLSSLVGWGGAKVSNASLRCTPRPNMGGEGGGIGRRGTNFRVGGGAGGRLAGPRSSLYLQPRGRQNKRAAVVTAGLFAGGVGMGVTALVLVGVAPLSSPSLHLVCLFATLFSVVLSYLCFPVVDSLLLAGRRGLRALLLPSQTGGRDRRKSRTSMRKSPFSSINLA